jgi:ketosteroid isomerase-like protein
MAPLDNPNTRAVPDEIIALERSYWEAMKAKDGAATAALSGETALVTGARGVVSIAKDKMGKMTEEGNWQLLAYDFDNVQVITPAPDVAVIAYTVRQTVEMNGETTVKSSADSSTWIRGSDGWECHAHSESFLDDQGSKQS